MKKYLLFFLVLITLRLMASVPGFQNENNAGYSADTLISVGSISIEGNEVTKPYIIKRELLFKVGDTMGVSRLDMLMEKSKNNLMNTSLFNFVKIDTAINPLTPKQIGIEISVTERWYIWPFPIIEIADRNLNTWWENKDLTRLNYGIYLVRNNFRGRREQINMLLRFGYNEKFQAEYKIPYINKKQTLGAGIAAGMNRNHEVAYKTQGDKRVYFNDDNEYPYEEYYGMGYLTYRRGIYNTHKLAIQYSDFYYGDTLLDLNDQFSFKNQSNIEFLSLHYKYVSDYRNYIAYPLTGYYFEGEVRKSGLGILSNKDLDMLYLRFMFSKYWHLKNRWYFAAGTIGKLSSGSFQPYFLQQGLGYEKDFVRGYEYYVIDGQHFGVLKSNLKYEVLPTQVFKLDFIPTDKFNKIPVSIYASAFTDLGYVYDDQFHNEHQNALPNDLLVGAGLGLDFITYYDKVMRVEFSVNQEKEAGLYFHFIAPL
ncbi:MAG: hypothetical protein K9I94_07745 [Bacteroidales bacterium]|nr:hypothetical protein [Bacteroidales bacterium]